MTTNKVDTVTSNNVTPTDVVDDIELLAILGLSPPPASPLSDLAVLDDWDDTPELSEEEEDDDEQSIGKRKRDQDDDLFAELDFIEVPLPPSPTKKQRSFVEEDLTLDLHSKLIDDEDIRLALDLISSST